MASPDQRGGRLARRRVGVGSALYNRDVQEPSEQRRLAALIESGMAMASELDLDGLLQKIADLARYVIGAEYAAVAVLGDDTSLIKFVHSGVPEETPQRIGRLPQGKGVLGVIIEEGRPLRLAEITAHPRSVGFPEHHPEMHSFLGVPMSARGRIYGRLYLTNKKDASEFLEEDERIALTFASQAGVAIENAHLYEEIKAKTEELAVLEERERIAKELHDGLIQSIYSVGLSLQGSSGLVERDPSRSKVRIEEAIAELDNVIRDVRSYIFELRPKELEEKGLIAAVEGLARELEVNTLAHVTVDLDESGCRALDHEAQAEVIQIVREILSNVARHAAASEVSVRCAHQSRAVELVVEDNGVGFDPSSVIRGFGLANIEERAKRIGGTLEISIRSPKGMRHILRIPATKAPGLA